jgi:hypothetical protein
MKSYKIKINDKEYDVLGCPFCGETPRFTKYTGGDCEIGCVIVLCITPVLTFYSDDELENAIEKWNTRA